MNSVYAVLCLSLSLPAAAQELTFRGLSNGISCEEAVAIESNQGSKFDWTSNEILSKGSYVVETKLHGTLESVPVEISLRCFASDDTDVTRFHEAQYVATFRDDAEAREFRAIVTQPFVAVFGEPKEFTHFREERYWPPGALPASTLPTSVTWDFGCNSSRQEKQGYRLSVSLRYPLPTSTSWQVVVYGRFDGGLCW